jgi:hypothetical protein
MAANEAHSNGVAREHAMLGEGGLFLFGIEAVGGLEEVDGPIEEPIVLLLGHDCHLEYVGSLFSAGKKRRKSSDRLRKRNYSSSRARRIGQAGGGHAPGASDWPPSRSGNALGAPQLRGSVAPHGQ